jgi:LCP family protein required for cell wall assembly
MRRLTPNDPRPDFMSSVPGPAGLPGPAAIGRSWAQRIILAVGVTVTIACLSASGFVTYQTARVAGIERLPDMPGIVDVGSDQPQNWLVVGSDTRGDVTGNRTDTIMVVRVDPAGTALDILSLHRDLWVPIAGTNHAERINSAYGNNESPQRLIDTIKLNFGIDINHYVEIGFQMFKAIVDAVGGVPMFIERGLKDDQIGLFITDLGCVTLDGDQALAFARSRHLSYNVGGKWIADPSSDHGRISRQQYFMRRMFARAMSKAKNPKIFNDLVSAANSYVKLDANVDLDQAGVMFRRFGSFAPDAIKTYSLPTKPVTKPSGAEVLEVVADGSVPILNIFRGFDEHDADPRTVTFSVTNGSGKPSQAAQVQDAYRAIGYRAEVAGDATGRVARTVVRYGAGGQEVAAQVERHLTAGGDVVADPNLGAGQVVLVTGADLTTVMRRPRPWAPPPEPVAASTTTTKAGRSAATTPPATEAPHNTGDSVVGVVPGEPPPGVDCS